MASLASIKEVLASAIPGVRFTSERRSQGEQDKLVAAGKTRAKNSQHVDGTALDLVLPKGFSQTDVDRALADAGVNLSESINETGRGRNQGTGPHLHIAWGDKGAPKQSTFDRVKAQREADTAEPSIAGVYQAYRAGQMSPNEAAAFENAVNDGAIILPRGGRLNREPAAYQLPKDVVDAYNSRSMDDEERARIDEALEKGEISLPKGAKLTVPPPRSVVEQLRMGVRDLSVGMDSLPDIVAGPANALVNAVAGTNLSTTPFRDLSESRPTNALAPQPESSGELLASAINQGGIQGLISSPLTSVLGAETAVSRVLTNPLADTLSGASAGGSQELARQSGAGPVGQFAAGLLGGGAGLGAIAAAERGAARVSRSAPRSAPDIAATTPREVVLDAAGDLTEEGRELALRAGVEPDQVRQAYDAPPNVRPANDGVSPDVARRAVNDDAQPERAGEAPPARPIEETPVSQPPESPAAAAATARAAEVETPLPEDALARVQQAQSEGISLSRGQATQDFATQDAEQTLRAQASGEGEQARTFAQQQAEDVKAAVDRFRSTFDDPETGAVARGQQVKDAIRELRDLGKQGVNAMYREARELGSDAVKLETAEISQAAKRALVEADIPDGVKNVIRQEMARYGLLGKSAVTAEDGLTTAKLDDGRKIQFYGPVEQLGLDNAENFRQAISAQYMADGPRKLSQPIKTAIDDAVESAVERAATTEKGDVGARLKQARSAVVEQKKTFAAKDVVQKLIDWKKGTQTDVVLPENAIKEIFSGDTTNLSKVKAVLLTKPTEASKAAWRAIQAQGVAQIFEKAVQRNANLGSGAIEAISGAKLRTEIAKFGSKKLRILLDEPDFNRLMKLQRIIGDVTIPISGTTNPSGSAFKIMRFLGPMAAKLVPFGGQVADTVAGLVQKGKEIAQAKETLKGVTEYTASEAAQDAAKQMPAATGSPGLIAEADEAARQFITDFIDTASTGRLVAPIVGASGGDEP